MRIAFIIPSLGPGGAERVATLLCSEWARQGHEVSLIPFASEEERPFFQLHPRVQLRHIATVNRARHPLEIIRTNILRIRRLRRLLTELAPDAVIAFMTEANVITLCATRGLGIATFVSERNQPIRPSVRRLRNLARRFTYGWATALVVQTDEIAAWARGHFQIPIHVLPNPVLLEREPDGKANTPRDREIIAAGRLDPQKGFDLLIESFSQLATKYPDWTLTIYGEGPERSSLERLIRDRSLTERIRLPGLSQDLKAAMQRAALFVLSSRFEGYPNVLLEALTCGCPVIATDCPGATAQALAGGRYGVLVPPEDPARLATAIESLIQSPAKRRALSTKAPEAVSGLALPLIAERWINLLAPFLRPQAARGDLTALRLPK